MSAIVDTTSNIDENVRRNVRVFMALRGLDGGELARELQLSRQVLSHRLTGVSRFTVPEVVRLAALLETTVEVLAEDPDGLVRSRCDATLDGAKVPGRLGLSTLPWWAVAA